MIRKLLPFLLVLALLPLALINCLGEDEEGDADTDVDTDVDTDADTDTDTDADFTVTNVDATSGSGEATPLDPAAGTETVVVMPYSLATTGGENAFAMTASAEPRTEPPPLPRRRPDGPDLTALTTRVAFDQYLRARVREWLLDLPDRSELVQGPPRALPTVGDTRDFGFETGATISAEAMAVGPGAVLWVDVDDKDSIAAADITHLHGTFIEISAPRDKVLFDYDAAVADKDGDGAVALLMTGKVNDVGEGFAGFFNAKDFGTGANSNEMDVLYIGTPANVGSLAGIDATMAHEFQHLINFSNKVVKHGLALPEETWLDEALAHLAEDVCGQGADSVNAVYAFLENFDTTSLTLTNYDGSSDEVRNRGAGYLFALYLVEQAGGLSYSGGTATGGGVAVLQALAGSDKQGIANVEAAAGRSFDDVFADWLAAVALDGTGATTDPRYNFRLPTEDPQTGALHGIDLRGSRENSEGIEVTLEGPATEDFDETEIDGEVVAGGAMHYLYYAPAGETVTLSISGDASAGLGFLVFVR